MSVRLLTGDCLTHLKTLADESVDCVVTSPPYWGLRNYGVAGAIGLEPTMQEHLGALVEVFREVRRVLRKTGTCWVNYGDAYAGGGSGEQGKNGQMADRSDAAARCRALHKVPRNLGTGLKPKDRMLLPARLAIALQDDGWWVRDEIIWHKPNPMPSSVCDRTTPAHEMIYLLTKSACYFYDADAIRTPPSDALLKQVMDGYEGADTKEFGAAGAQSASGTKRRIIEGARKKVDKQSGHSRRHAGFNDRWDSLTKEEQQSLGANKRSVWTIAPKPFRGAHFATFPPALIEPCILAGCPIGGTVLDPFGGAGTTGLVAQQHGRDAILIEINPEYVEIARRRLFGDAPLFAEVEAA